jgi:hypothetical protein
MGTSPEVSIGGGWPRPPILGLVAVCTAGGAVAGFVRWATTDSALSLTSFYAWIGLGVITIVVVVVATSYFTFVRSVRVALDDVEFIVGARRVRVRWADLVPPTYPYFLGINFQYRVDGKIQENDPLVLTKAQALAILAYPSAARWTIPRAVRESLGMAGGPAPDRARA